MQAQVSERDQQANAGHTVASVMRPAATTVEAHGHLAAAAYTMNHADQSALVVVDPADRPVAIITEGDLMRAVAQGSETANARIDHWMNPNPPTVGPDTTVHEAARIMVDTGNRHLPVVSDERVVGVVAISDIVHAIVRSVQLASVVLFVSDLPRSLGFYQPLLNYSIVASDADAALLTGPDGSQLYLRQVGDRSTQPNDGVGVQLVAWTAGGPDDLDRCTKLLQERGAYEHRDTNEGITRLVGRDPDGLPVLITYPGPDQAPRHLLNP